jgi:hypothetical protein
MTHAVTEQKMPLVVAQPVTITDVLPEDVLLQILVRIFAPRDVVNLSLVSKQILQLNQNGTIVFPRVQALYADGINGLIMKHSPGAVEYRARGIILNAKSINGYEDYTREYAKTRTVLPEMFYIYLSSRNQRNELKTQIWIANNKQDDGLGENFGDEVVWRATQKGQPKYCSLMRAAIANYLSNSGGEKKSS